MPPGVGWGEAIGRGEERVQLGERERAGRERGAMPFLIWKVALDPNRAEQEPTELHGGRVGCEAVLDGTTPAGDPHPRAVAVPAQRRGAPVAVARREAHAGVLGVGQQGDDAPLATVEVDLDGVGPGVPVEARLVALVGGGVVEAGLGEGEDRERLPGGSGELGQYREGEKVHGPDWLAGQGDVKERGRVLLDSANDGG